MKNSLIENIITKKLLEEASSEELLLLEKWRKESQQNENLYQEYTTIWNASANYIPTNFQPNSELAYQKHIDLLSAEKENIVQLTPKPVTNETTQSSIGRVFTLRRIASIAALFVIVFGAMAVFNAMNTTTISASNGVAFASLEDGSSIWLDKGSSISYDSGFGEYHRDLKLNGKAFFSVKKNKNIEFTIASNDMNVSVLGTSFTVDAKSGNKVVVVKTGKVSVEVNEKKVTLFPNEKVSFVNNDFIEGLASDDDVLWRNKNLSFENARLDQVIADINLFHNDKIILKGDTKNLDCPFTSRSLTETSFENIIEILKITYDLQTQEDPQNGNITLTISDCK
jgi:transmembrane sensor